MGKNLKTYFNNKYLVLSILISILSLMCNENSNITNSGDDNNNFTCKDTVRNYMNPLYPGNVGTYWQYKYFFNSQLGEEDTGWVYNGFISFSINFNDGSWSEDSFKVEIENKRFICLNDTTYECNIHTGYPLNLTDSNLIRWAYWNGNDGIYSMGLYNNTDSLFHKGLYIKYPLIKGDNWKDKIVITDGYAFYLFEFTVNECISEMEIINTPAGSFPCYVIYRREEPEDVGGYYDYYEYYSPNVGLVCSVKKYTIPPPPGIKGYWRIISVEILTQYSIKN